jgi:hypothetical protein
MENSKTILTFVKSLNSDKKCRNERRKTPLEDGHRPQEQRWVKKKEDFILLTLARQNGHL